MTLADLNATDADLLAPRLLECCGSTRWVAGMIQRRPFATRAELGNASDEVWQGLATEDWQEAFSKHPKIGEKRPVSAWSAQEQGGMQTATVDVSERLALLNRQYFEKFGFIFIVCATGKSAQEMLALLEQRLPNSPESELRNAAAEQAKIAKLRLEKLLGEGVR